MIKDNSNWITVKNKKPIKNKNTQNIIYDKDIFNKENELLQTKKILCNNMIMRGKCNYGNKCNYAHNIEEQNVDMNRKKAYDIIMDNKAITSQPDTELQKYYYN